MYEEPKRLTRRVLKITGFYIGVLLLSSWIFAYMENWSFFEALYQIVITVSTVGFAEIREVSDLGRAYLMGMIVFQTGFFVYVASQIAYLVAEGKLLEILRYRRLVKMLEKIRGHTIVIGLGRTGVAIAETLISLGEKVVAIDTDPERIESFKGRFPGVPVIEGDAKDEGILELAKIREAKRLFVNTSSDSENVFIVVTARGMNPDLFISSRVVDVENEPKLKRAGADQTFVPESFSGRSVALSILKPEVSRFLTEVLLSEESPYTIEEVEVGESSPIRGRSLRDFFNEEVFGILLAIVREGKLIVSPQRDTKVEVGDKLIVLGSLEQVENLISAVES